jgi:hypothetical protein
LLVADPLKITELSPAKYHFERSELIGTDLDYRLSLNAGGAFKKERHADQIMDSYGDLLIKKLPDEDNLVLLLTANADEGLILPRGNWKFFTVERNEIILNDNTLWLRIATESNPYATTRAEANKIYAFTIDRDLNYLLASNNELSLWRPMFDPELLYRQSEPIIAAGCHDSGHYVYYATKSELRMMDLDNRNGHIQTTIAWFDEINDAVLIDEELYIAGTKNQKTGLWKIPLVKPATLSPLGIIDGAIRL